MRNHVCFLFHVSSGKVVLCPSLLSFLPLQHPRPHQTRTPVLSVAMKAKGLHEGVLEEGREYAPLWDSAKGDPQVRQTVTMAMVPSCSTAMRAQRGRLKIGFLPFPSLMPCPLLSPHVLFASLPSCACLLGHLNLLTLPSLLPCLPFAQQQQQQDVAPRWRAFFSFRYILQPGSASSFLPDTTGSGEKSGRWEGGQTPRLFSAPWMALVVLLLLLLFLLSLGDSSDHLRMHTDWAAVFFICLASVLLRLESPLACAFLANLDWSYVALQVLCMSIVLRYSFRGTDVLLGYFICLSG